MDNRYSDKTEQDLIQLAWEVQDACNLSGVLLSFTDAFLRLKVLVPDRDKQNNHIMTKLFTSKILSLVGDLPYDISGYGINFSN